MGSQVDVKTLVAQCREGDEGAWKDLVSQYENLVFSTALQTGLDQDAAVDVFQQVWVELHRSLFRIKDPQALPRWLIVTTRRISYRQAVTSGRWVRDLREDLVDPTPRADEVVSLLELRQQIQDGMAGLDPRCRRVVELFFFTEPPTSYQDASKELGLAEDSIGSLKSRCLDRLRKSMEVKP